MRSPAIPRSTLPIQYLHSTHSNKSNYQLAVPTVGAQKHRGNPTFQLIQLVSNHWTPTHHTLSAPSPGATGTQEFQQIQLPTQHSNCGLAKTQGKSNIPANPAIGQPWATHTHVLLCRLTCHGCLSQWLLTSWISWKVGLSLCFCTPTVGLLSWKLD